jgi:hypothetical protein
VPRTSATSDLVLATQKLVGITGRGTTGNRRWHTAGMEHLGVIVAAVAAIAVVAVLFGTAFLGFRQLRRFFRGEY